MPVDGKFYAVATCVVEVEDQIRLELLLDTYIPLLLIRDWRVIQQSARTCTCPGLYAAAAGPAGSWMPDGKGAAKVLVGVLFRVLVTVVVCEKPRVLLPKTRSEVGR